MADRLARRLIIVGGIGTIAAVLSVCVFLLWVTAPLFLPARVDGRQGVSLADQQPPVEMAVDEFRTMAWTMTADGRLRVVRLDDGSLLAEHALAQSAPLTAWSQIGPDGVVALGYQDGSVRLGRIHFASRFIDARDLPEAARTDEELTRLPYEGGLLERTPERHWRHARLLVELEDPLPWNSAEPVGLIDQVTRGATTVVAAMSAGGQLRVASVRQQTNLAGQRKPREINTFDVGFEPPTDGQPRYLVLSGLGDQVYLAWPNGELLRFDARDLTNIRVVESRDLVDEPGAELTAFAPLLGRATLIAGDSRGQLRAWFGVKPAGVEIVDGTLLVPAHTLPSRSVAVSSLGMSSRSRLVAVGYADGYAALIHVTSRRLLMTLSTGQSEPVTAVAIAPKDDGVAASAAGGLSNWAVDVRHPEATLTTLLRPVWYEGYPAPAHVWQSSSGADDSEPKLGLMPLIFGTLKATFYSLLFGVPIALLAAVYASEFMTKRVRSRIKPTIELMAGLPSVVLGFVAALVLAPLVERWLMIVLTAVGTVPLAILTGAFLWQLLPERTALRLAPWRFVFVLAAIPLGGLIALWLAPGVERLLFAGNIQLWLDDHQRGAAIGGWMLLFLPLSAILTAWFMGREVTPRLRKITADWTRLRCGLVDLARFVVATLVTLALALGFSLLLAAMGWDARGAYIDTYVQRNALVVGFVMGFAIIPLIYTIAEDALSSVPEHLRSASLGAGATPWQTATRVIIPTAMSGLFSAVMIGLGRAVGETMIVLMAAGNTPIMEANIFSGFRTLSANLAVELPEAVRNSTHFRTLFLAALALFAMTFVVNTIAEAVRQRFRRRAFQL